MLTPSVIKDRRSFIELSPSVMDTAARDCSEQHKRGNAVLASYAYIKILDLENRTDRRRSLFPSLVRKFWLFSVVIADRNAKNAVGA